MSKLGECDEVRVVVAETSSRDTSEYSEFSSRNELPPRIVFESELSLEPKEFPPPVGYENRSRTVNLTSEGNLNINIQNESSSSSDSDSSEQSDSSSVDSDSTSSSDTTSSCTDDTVSSTSSGDSSSNSSEDEPEELFPLFANDGIVGNLNSPNIISKVFPDKSADYIITSIKKEIKSLNRDIWLSVGNFDVVAIPDSLVDLTKRNDFRKEAISSFRKSLDQFNTEIKSKGGRLFLMEIFPSPQRLIWHYYGQKNVQKIHCYFLVVR